MLKLHPTQDLVKPSIRTTELSDRSANDRVFGELFYFDYVIPLT